ncbi:cystathionine beta-lyase [Cupriavidus pauculus]|uniref:cystathionine beta-lyase n=1 Tax=Cupriavidus pauculus TaxID=82633 RepID=UPI00124666D0|nr:cystathionine beta-lyase [Cupriavidus pauculus]KAB0605007.1 cystathionine beta-lyase [Cupriavidus pauculus]MCM3604895.1 cystathionine beta-lyase [Cupriavidus pauculus]UAK99364.1 cystathionine beta-lyase [Cupriavidus pauculus]
MSASDSSRKSSHYIQTTAVQPELDIAPGFESFSTPTYRGSTIVFRNLAELRAYGDRSKTYWRYGLHATPTSEALCQQLAQIEGGRQTLLLPSGMGAISLVYFACLRSGDDVLVPDNVYGPNRDHGEWLAREYGVTVRYYHPSIGAGIAALIQPNTRLIWMEAPGSVTMEVPDSEAIVAAARARGVLTAIDNTWSAGVYFKPFEKGIDISVQALTKYQSGGSDVLMGAVITRDEKLHDRLKRTRMIMGWGVSADDCFLVLRGLSSMPVRLAAHDRAAREVAEWLKRRPEVTRVLHPALPDCPGHDAWQRDFTGGGGLFSLIVHRRYTPEQVDAFVEALKLFAIGWSWGGAHSLAVPYHVETMRPAGTWPPAGWENAGELVRLYIGLEDTRDLIADLKQAMETHLR